MRLFSFLRCVSKLPKDWSNFPERYVKRSMEQIEWKTPKGIQYLQKVIKKRKFLYGMHRPWTHEFQMENPVGKNAPTVYVEPIKEWCFFRGDRVEILVGKDKGKHGIVNYIVKERNWVCVEGLNCRHKYIGQKGSQVMIKDEMPLLVTNEVALIDPSDNKPTKVEWRYTEEGKKVRVSARTGRIIPISKMAEETYDYKERSLYNEQPKDTVAKKLEEITFIPSLKTFQQEIMEEMGIEETRTPHPTYWY